MQCNVVYATVCVCTALPRVCIWICLYVICGCKCVCRCVFTVIVCICACACFFSACMHLCICSFWLGYIYVAGRVWSQSQVQSLAHAGKSTQRDSSQVQVIQSEEYRGPKWQVINDLNHGSASNSSSLPQPTLCFCGGSFVSIMPHDLGRRIPNRIAKKRRNGERKEERVEKMQLKEWRWRRQNADLHAF